MRWILLALMLLWAQVSTAEQVGIRSAEHDGFTRVVIDTARPLDVSIRQSDDMLEIELPSTTKSIAAPDFFGRITRERIEKITMDQQGKSVSLAMACECTVKTSVQPGRMFILDIYQAAQNQAASPQPLAEFTPVRPARRLRLPEQSVRPQSDTSFAEEPPAGAPPSSAEDVTLPAVSPGRGHAARGAQVALQRRLIEALQVSREQGTAQGTSASSTKKTAKDQITFRSLAKTQARAMPKLEGDLEGAFRNCDDAALLNPAAWPRSDSAIETLHAMRSDLLSRENLDDAALRGLAVMYLSLGMGAEAAQLVGSISASAPQDLALFQFAGLVDGDTDFENLRSVIGSFCEELLVWHLFSGHRLNAEQKIKARRDFDQWPRALKGVFAARFAEVLILDDEPDAAAMVLRKSDAQPELREGERALVQAQLAELDKDEARAFELREGIVAQDLETAPEAAIALIEQSTIADAPPPDAAVAALASYRSERRGDDIEKDILRASITSAVRSHDFAQAFALLADFGGMARRSQVDMALDEILSEIAVLPSDAQFLREAMSAPAKDFARAGADIKAKIQSRILQLGFEDLAAQLGEGPRAPQSVAPVSDRGTPSSSEIDSAAADAREKQKASGDASPVRKQPAEARAARSELAGNTAGAASLPKALEATRSVLAEVEALKSELAELGIEPMQP